MDLTKFPNFLKLITQINLAIQLGFVPKIFKVSPTYQNTKLRTKHIKWSRKIPTSKKITRMEKMEMKTKDQRAPNPKFLRLKRSPQLTLTF